MEKRMKQLFAWILTAALLLSNTGITAKAAEETVLLYRGEERLEDGDVIGEDDILYWRTEAGLSDETEYIELPENLVYAGKRHITLEDFNGTESRAELIDTADGTGLTIKNPLSGADGEEDEETVTAASPSNGGKPAATPSDGRKESEAPKKAGKIKAGGYKEATASLASPSNSLTGKHTGEYRLTIPCKADALGAGEDGALSVGGLSLTVVRNGAELENITQGLYKSVNGEPSANPVKNGDTLSLVDDLVLVVKRADMNGVAAGIDYVVSLPDVIGAPKTDGSGPLEVVIGGVKTQFGTLSWTAGSTELTIRFIDFTPVVVEGISIGLNDLTDVHMNFNCNLDDENLRADDQGRIVIDLPGEVPFTVIISELVPKAPELKKEAGSLNDSGLVDWTVTYTHPVSAYVGDKPDKLADTLPQGMEYVSGSGAVTADPPDGGLSLGLTEEPGTNRLTCQIPDSLPGGTVLTIRYQTRITDEKMGQIWNLPRGTYRFSNQAAAQKADGSGINPALSAEASVEVPGSWGGRNMLAKNGEVTADGKINWTVTVNTASRGFKTLYVLDTMGKGLELDESTLSVTGPSGPAGNRHETANVDGKTQLTVYLVEGGVPAQAESSYEITYTTRIKDEYFDQTGTEAWTDRDVSNEASLRYEWPDGSGLAPLYPPSVGKGPGDLGIDNHLIRKEKTGNYNRADHSMPWKITVNPNGVNITEAELVDDISTLTPGHTFIPAGKSEADVLNEIRDAIERGIAEKGISADVIREVSLSGDVMTVRLGALGNETFSFTVVTYAKDPAFWASNGTATFHNSIVMKQRGTKVNSQPIRADSGDGADHPAESNVLKKRHTGYDPSTKKMTWELTVNENQTDLGDVTIQDQLPAGLICSADDIAEARIDGAAFSGNQKFQVDSQNLISISLKGVTGKHVIHFPVTVDVDSAPFFSSSEVRFPNFGRIQSAANTAWVNSQTAAPALENQAIGKRASHRDKDTKVSYTVSLNPLGTDLLKDLPAGGKLYITDTLDDGLYLDLDSVKLIQAQRSVRRNGDKYQVVLSEVPGGEVTAAVSYNAPANSFSVEIPDAKAGYLLKYDAYIVRSGLQLSNHIKLEGSAIPEDSGNREAQAGFYMNSFGGASFKLPSDKFFSMQIKKVDEGGRILGGAEFGLYTDRRDETLLASGTCDSATGICTLAVPKSRLTGGDTLYWKETKAPVGYVLNDEWREVRVNPAPDTVFTVTNLTDGAAASGRAEIRKVEKGTGVPLSGARFRLYAEPECLTPVGEERETGNDGTAVFDGLYPARTYWLKETAAPEGYVILTAPIPVKAEAGSPFTPVSIENEKAQVRVTISVNDGKTGMSFRKGGRFQLFFDKECLRPAGAEAVSDENGNLTFTGLQPHFTYFLSMLSPVDGYRPDRVYTVTTGDNNQDVPVRVEVFKDEQNMNSGSHGSSPYTGRSTTGGGERRDGGTPVGGPGVPAAPQIPDPAQNPLADLPPEPTGVSIGADGRKAAMEGLPRTGEKRSYQAFLFLLSSMALCIAIHLQMRRKKRHS